MRRGSHHRCTTKPLRRFSVVAALLAVIVQALVVQTHVDFWPTAHVGPGVAHSVSHVTAQAPGQSQEGPLACPICQALAWSGRAVLAASAVLAHAEGVAVEAAAPQIRSVPARPAHAWRSRAPPLSL